MNPEIMSDILKFLKRNELDKFRNVKNYCIKQISEQNSFNMFRVKDFDDFKNHEKWKLYKNLDYSWMKNEGNMYVRRLISRYEMFIKPGFESKKRFDLFSCCDLARFIKKMALYGSEIDDTIFEWVENFKNLKKITLKKTNISSKCIEKIEKMYKITIINRDNCKDKIKDDYDSYMFE